MALEVANPGEEDFLAALEALGGCNHIGNVRQALDTICRPCRTGVASLVLLRDHYRRDKEFFKGVEKKK